MEPLRSCLFGDITREPTSPAHASFGSASHFLTGLRENMCCHLLPTTVCGDSSFESSSEGVRAQARLRFIFIQHTLPLLTNVCWVPCQYCQEASGMRKQGSGTLTHTPV